MKSSIVQNDFISIFKEDIKFPDGNVINDYYFVQKKDYSVIVPIVEKGDDPSIILAYQYRPAAQKMIWNLPMGFIEKHESPLQAAQRELLEETGLEGNLTKLCTLMPAPSFYISTCHIFMAENLTTRKTSHDTEVIELKKWKLSELIRNIGREGMVDMTTAASLLIAKNNLEGGNSPRG